LVHLEGTVTCYSAFGKKLGLKMHLTLGQRPASAAVAHSPEAQKTLLKACRLPPARCARSHQVRCVLQRRCRGAASWQRPVFNTSIHHSTHAVQGRHPCRRRRALQLQLRVGMQHLMSARFEMGRSAGAAVLHHGEQRRRCRAAWCSGQGVNWLLVISCCKRERCEV